MRTSVPLSSLPMWALVVLGVVALAQIAVELWALLDMLRTPADRLTLDGRKWLWAILILGVSWIGAIVYFAAGRKPAPAVESASSAAASERSAAAMDSLYGKREGDGS